MLKGLHHVIAGKYQVPTLNFWSFSSAIAHMRSSLRIILLSRSHSRGERLKAFSYAVTDVMLYWEEINARGNHVSVNYTNVGCYRAKLRCESLAPDILLLYLYV